MTKAFMEDRPCIAVHGSYGNGNFGDWLLLRILVQEIRSQVAGARVVLPLGSLRDAKEIGADDVGMARARHADHLVFGGGGYLGAPASGETRWALRNAFRHLLPRVALGTVLQVPYLVSGVGVGPIRTRSGRAFVRSMLKAATRVTVRDSSSFEWARDLCPDGTGIEMGTDWALALCEPGPIQDGRRQERMPHPVLHVSRAWWTDRRWLALCRGIVRRAEDEGLHRWCVVADNLSDNRLLTPRYLHDLGLSRSRIGRIERFESVDQMLTVLQTAGCMITTKLHLGLCGQSLGWTVVSLAAHPKIQPIYADLGMPRLMEEMWKNDWDERELTNRVVHCLLQPSPRRTRWVSAGTILARNRSTLSRFLGG